MATKKHLAVPLDLGLELALVVRPVNTARSPESSGVSLIITPSLVVVVTASISAPGPETPSPPGRPLALPTSSLAVLNIFGGGRGTRRLTAEDVSAEDARTGVVPLSNFKNPLASEIPRNLLAATQHGLVVVIRKPIASRPIPRVVDQGSAA